MRQPLETVEKPIGFFDKVSCRTLRAPFVRLRRTKNTLVPYIVFCVVYTPLHKMNLISFAAKAANSARLFWQAERALLFGSALCFVSFYLIDVGFVYFSFSSSSVPEIDSFI